MDFFLVVNELALTSLSYTYISLRHLQVTLASTKLRGGCHSQGAAKYAVMQVAERDSNDESTQLVLAIESARHPVPAGVSGISVGSLVGPDHR